MDNTHDNELSQQPSVPEEAYVSRPVWQVWGARAGVVVFIVFIIVQLLQIAGGGL